MLRTLGLLLLTVSLSAQTAPTPAPLNSHEVHADGSITFRYRAPDAKKVEVSFDGLLKPLVLQLDADGLWSATTPPMPPQVYGYAFHVDGVPMFDPRNNDVRPNMIFVGDEVTVRGTPPMPWELQNIAHGVVSTHRFATAIAINLPANQSEYLVYTPPGYDAKRKAGYPVLYLLHGYSDPATGWVDTGRAANIMDSLIDSGKAVPMIVVMPLGYGNFDFVLQGFGAWNHAAMVDENTKLFSDELEREVIPMVEHEYDVAPGRDNRGIIGLSMGGLESLSIGLNHTAQFAYIGGLSSALQDKTFDKLLPDLQPKTANLKLLWVACGVDDKLLTPNRAFVVWAKDKGLPVTAIETPGHHEWPVWRDNLVNFAPLLFRK